MMKHNRIYYPIPLESEEEYEEFERSVMKFNGSYKVESSPEAQAEHNKLKKELLKENTAVLEKTNLFDFYNSAVKKEEKTELEQFIIAYLSV